MRKFIALTLLFYLAACAKITNGEIEKVGEVARALPAGCVVSESYVSPGGGGYRRHVSIQVDCYEVAGELSVPNVRVDASQGGN